MLDQQIEAQEALDDLFNERLLPFRLKAHKVRPIGMDEYVVYFYDSRLQSIDITWNEGESFKRIVREAVLERVSRSSSAVKRKAS